MQNGVCTMKNSVKVAKKFLNKLPKDPAIPILDTYLKMLSISREIFQTPCSCSTIYNSQDVETT